MWLVLFAALFVVLFVIFAVAQGIGAPSVPSGDAAIVKDVPSGEATISEAEVKRTIGQQIAAASSESKEKAPKPGSKKYEEVKEAALGELMDLIWLRGQAEEMGISATDKQVEEKLAEIKKQSFPTEKAWREFLKKSHFTKEDVNKRVEEQIFSAEIQEQVKAQAEPPSADEIQAYYDENKAAQFTTPASRDVRVVVNKDKAKVEAAKKALEAGNQSVATWKTVAKKYSSDPTTKTNGGLQKGITEEFVKGELKKAIFDNPTGELSGPIEFEKNFLLIEPVKVNPKKVKTLAEVKSQISQTLAQQKQEAFFTEFVTEYQERWTSRTYCASGFTIERCANYKGSGHPSTASAACYEPNPKAPAKECPAPVTMNTPAIPGTVTTSEPKGERLVQRPQPEGLAGGKSGAKAEVPEGAAETPTGE